MVVTELTWNILAGLADKHKDAEAILRAAEHEIYRLFQD